MFSLRGFRESLKQQYKMSQNEVEKIVITNLINLSTKLIVEHGVDVCYQIPENKIFLNNFEKKIYSQFQEDGITEKIFEVIGTTNKFYLDFGGTENTNNSEVLHKEHGFNGVLWNGDDLPCEYTKIHKEFITRENIIELCKKYNVPKEFDFLSIDIDGNDWYIWKKMCEEKEYQPRVVVIEYNATFPPPEDKIMEYKSDYSWDLSIYQSASIQAMYNLGRKLGYSLVCAESFGYNLFFVRDDVVGDSFHGVNNVEMLYRTPKLGHRPCGPDGVRHTEDCLKTYRLDGILGHKPDLLNRPWISSSEAFSL